jgi:DNA-directed RNA polymerase beta' subunit
MSRPFTDFEIDQITDRCILLSKTIPIKSAKSFRKKNRRKLADELRLVKLKPSLIGKFTEVLCGKYQQAAISPGESVGILCAQSIGEMNTQMTLNSFHHAGISEAAMTSGVPKFQELLSATRNPKLVNMSIFFIKRPSTLKELIHLSRNKIQHLLLKDIITKNWVSETESQIILELNWKTMYKYTIYPVDIILRIKREFPDVNSYISETMNLIISVPTDTLRDENENFENVGELLNKVVRPEILKVPISGVPNIKNIFYEKKINDDGDTEWFIRTEGSNFLKVLSTEGVDAERTMSNHVWDIYNNLGIEAARNALLCEFESIMAKINPVHTNLLVDRMTFGGTINSISRYTMKKEQSSVLGKASFEESLDHFLKASFIGTTENTNGNSASIVCGKKTRAGTGFMKLMIDLDAYS